MRLVQGALPPMSPNPGAHPPPSGLTFSSTKNLCLTTTDGRAAAGHRSPANTNTSLSLTGSPLALCTISPSLPMSRLCLIAFLECPLQPNARVLPLPRLPLRPQIPITPRRQDQSCPVAQIRFRERKLLLRSLFPERRVRGAQSKLWRPWEVPGARAEACRPRRPNHLRPLRLTIVTGIDSLFLISGRAPGRRKGRARVRGRRTHLLPMLAKVWRERLQHPHPKGC